MNSQIEKLYHIANQKERRILGLMSGTSLDGLDIALCRVHQSGSRTRLSLEKFTSVSYDDSFRMQIRAVFAKRQIDQQTWCGLHALVGKTHAQLVKETLQQWDIASSDVDLIASHGQTVYHAPQRLTGDRCFPNSTLQIGDADHIAYDTGIITVSDFRQKHIAAGGEGAPLAAYGDYLLFTAEAENRILLNIGGISNFTFLPQKTSNTKAFASDIGPGNTLMNQFVLEHFDLEMDKDAQIAKQGAIDRRLLEVLLSAPFFAEGFPKTTGPELFNLTYLKTAQAISGTSALAPKDVLATLNRFTAQVIANAIRNVTKDLQDVHIYVSGGGLHNPLLMKNIRASLVDLPVSSFGMLGLDPDAKEACLFAVLANETLVGSPRHVKRIKDAPEVCMGKISLPY
ncbi:anhydro-N-acetylmuramic acid kinase [Sphingobacterium sp. FBM7-1]|uniref:anhydro-N-acetylmuramic acid kinase n=1 Tax=Sphingobacterium sp. FBM7-1 TaxID=2886688 RepID=UPI001D1008F0|nr:anhydro-N-acetylmuramic acid kinase [Sphingobacterium sp. FBM7-1]MCC2599805.1 anhydro-N-acetylmuramic acid kinase [Sphingobacterium sp. FBM7-1]